MDLKRICRICLRSNKQTFDIYTSYYLKRQVLYADILTICTKLKPYEEDGLPRLVCKECTIQLKRCYDFNLYCLENDTKLRKYVNTYIHEGIQGIIKEEKKSNEITNTERTESGCDPTAIEDFKQEIEEDIIVDNSYWNAVKNNFILEETKEAVISEIVNGTDEEENKKGRKSKDEATVEDNDDSYWNADDNNFILETKYPKNAVLSEIRNGTDKVKKKRGRKRKVSDVPIIEDNDDSYWDAEDDNIILEDIKYHKEAVHTVIEEPEPDDVIDTDTGVPKSKLPHQCDICGKFLSNKSNLKAHKISHTDLRPYKCPDCPATFRGHSALFQHKRIHSGETPYHCEYCPKQFRRRTGFLNHIRMHTGEKSYSCKICSKKFIQSGQLSIHMKRHNGDKSFLCQNCGKGFPLKSDLKVHQRMHNGEKPYSCHLCTKTFATSGNLSIHVRIHNKEIRYNCSECQRGFVTCSSYNVHLKRHKGQRDYQCECGKTFYTSSALKQHKVVHTGEKKYQCKICERKFTQTSHLSRHVKRDHVKSNIPPQQHPDTHYKVMIHQLFDMPTKETSFNVPPKQESGNSNEAVKCEH